MTRFLGVFFFMFTSLYAGSVFLVNDSPFALEAEIYAANGTLLGRETLKPGQNLNSSLDPTGLDIPQDSKGSLTPYSVIWRCKNGGFYSVCSSVLPGGLVEATQGTGNLYCAPSEQKRNS